MHLEILSPENKIFEGEVNSVIFPGSNGKFQILNNHAPLISFLKEGEILLILGKGHEEFQEIKGIKIPFNDQRVVEEIL